MSPSLPLLSLIVFSPWLGAIVLALLPKLGHGPTRVLGLAFSLTTLALAGLALCSFDPYAAGFQLSEQHAWIASLNVHFRLGLDGLSLVLVLLTGLLGPLSILASWRQAANPRLLCALFLFLQGAALGVFLALDFVPWFLFWELSLVPAYFLIRLWGGAGATRAAYQFVIYTVGGSAFMLLGFAGIFLATGTLDFTVLASLAADGSLGTKLATLGGFWPTAVFFGVLLGLAVKVPLFPFHTWLPSAYAEAPTGASMFMTGVMSKMGVYGFFRILWPLFPGALHRYAPGLLWLALGGVVFGAFAAMKQRDLKRMVAYSSINHVSYCLLALFAVCAVSGPNTGAATAALTGAILQVFNHGISAGALFFCVGVLESRSAGLRGVGDFGGVRAAAPLFAGLCGISLFSSLGLPGLNGFVGEFLIFRGVWGLVPWSAAVSCLGLFATAFFLLTFWQRVFHGPKAGSTEKGFADLTVVEVLTLLPFVALMFALGIVPQLLTVLVNPLVGSWVARLAQP